MAQRVETKDERVRDLGGRLDCSCSLGSSIDVAGNFWRQLRVSLTRLHLELACWLLKGVYGE